MDLPFGNGQGWSTSRQYSIVGVVAEDGTAGYGECWGPIPGTDELGRGALAGKVLGTSFALLGLISALSSLLGAAVGFASSQSSDALAGLLFGSNNCTDRQRSEGPFLGHGGRRAGGRVNADV